MENKLLECLKDVGYDVSSLPPDELAEALNKGPKSVIFTSLVSWLADQLVMFGGLEEKVHATESPDDASSFLLELSLFLKELGCVNKQLMSGNVNQRLGSKQDRMVLLDYLVKELMTSKILEMKKPADANKLELTIHESSTAKCLKDMLIALNFPKPPDNISTEMLYNKLETKLKEVIASAPPDLVGKPLFTGELSPAQWEKLDKLQEDMNVEYKMRREMLLKRLDVTVQSFLWSDRIKPREDQLNSIYHDKRNLMTSQPNVTLAHLLAARDDLAIIEKTSNATVRKNTQSGINKVIIGVVPDRGGRPQDQQPPPPEMPSWQKDRVPDAPHRGGRGGRGGGSGGGGGRGGGSGGGGGRGGGSGGGGGGFRDNKDASRNFGQNREEPQRAPNYSGFENQPPSYGDNRGGEYHRGGGGRGRGGGGEYYRGDGGRGRGDGGEYYRGDGGRGRGDGGEYYRGDGGRGRGGGGDRGRGNRVQGGWNQRGRGTHYY